MHLQEDAARFVSMQALKAFAAASAQCVQVRPSQLSGGIA
jgi:hypothetical protein